MKILIILLRHKGGVGRVVENLTDEMRNLNHKIKILSREDDLKCFSLLKSFNAFRKEFSNRKDYDILFTQDWSMALPLIYKKNHFCLFHGLEKSKISSILQKMVGNILGKNLFVVDDKMLEIFPKATIAPNGISKIRFFNQNKERKYLGWIKRDYDLISEEQVKELAKEKGLKLSIAENIAPDKMNDWYNSLKAFISMPPSYSGFNMCWGEAILAGVPEVMGNSFGVGIENIKKNVPSTKKQTNIILDKFYDGSFNLNKESDKSKNCLRCKNWKNSYCKKTKHRIISGFAGESHAKNCPYYEENEII